MTIKKIVSILCLLATTALAGTPTYKPFSQISNSNMLYPNGLAIDNNNHLYVTAGSNSKMLVFNATTGAVINSSLATPSSPRGGLGISGDNLYTITLSMTMGGGMMGMGGGPSFLYGIFTCPTSGGSSNTFFQHQAGKNIQG